MVKEVVGGSLQLALSALRTSYPVITELAYFNLCLFLGNGGLTSLWTLSPVSLSLKVTISFAQSLIDPPKWLMS